MIITIARECGSGGHKIGEMIAAHYGIKCYDRLILVEKAREKGLYEELENFFSEKPMDSLLYSIAINEGVKKNSNNILNKFKSLLDEESFVLIGRCGNYIYKDDSELTSVFIHSCMENKVIRTVRKQNMDRIKATQLVEFVEKKREEFHKRYTGENWGDARKYQLCLDSSVLGEEKSVETIVKFICDKNCDK